MVGYWGGAVPYGGAVGSMYLIDGAKDEALDDCEIENLVNALGGYLSCGDLIGRI